MRRPRVAFRAEASPVTGGGHVMRCLALAEALMAGGCEVAFLVNPDAAQTAPRLGQLPIRVLALDAADRSGRQALARYWPDGADIAVIDHYGLSAPHEDELRPVARHIAVIDDLADRPHACDLLIDTSAARIAADYSGRVPDSCRLLLGPTYAMLRDEFIWARPLALERRGGEPPRRVILSMGLTDLDGITGRIAKAWIAACPDIDLACVVGPQAESLPVLNELAAAGAKLAIHVSPDSVAALMVEADYAIGAAGTTAWERCCLGLPSTVVTVAANQFENADLLQARGAAVVAKQLPPDAETIVASTLPVLRQPQSLATMAASAAAICDGQGVAKVNKALLELLGAPPSPLSDSIDLRRAVAADALPVWCWRNDKAARQASLDSRFIAWDDHRRWFAQALASDRRIILMGSHQGRPCGNVRFDRLEETGAYRVSISLDPALRGRGLGRRLLAAAIDDLPRSPARLLAEVKADNIASLKIFTSCQFDIDRREGEVFHLSRMLP